jgi:hypothetical protein
VKRSITSKVSIAQSNISKNANSELPDVMYIRDNTQVVPELESSWDVRKYPGQLAVIDTQVEIGIYKLVKVLNVASIIRITEDILQGESCQNLHKKKSSRNFRRKSTR